MPFVNIRTYTGALSNEEKRALQEKITDLMVAYEGKGNPLFRKLVWVMIEEEAPQNWMLGGQNVQDLMYKNESFKESYLRNRNETTSQ